MMTMMITIMIMIIIVVVIVNINIIRIMICRSGAMQRDLLDLNLSYRGAPQPPSPTACLYM